MVTGGAGANPYIVRATADRVEAWSTYQIQFNGERRHTWQNDLVGELKSAIGRLTFGPDHAVHGIYGTTNPQVCDVENRLFTNPGASAFPSNTSAIRWERTPYVPAPPQPLTDTGGAVHYYAYQPSSTFRVWTPDTTLARWVGVPRVLTDDGTARPTWLAIRQAVLRGDVKIMAGAVPLGTRFGMRIVVHAPSRGPRSAPAASEALIDGVISALHVGTPAHSVWEVATALGARLHSVGFDELVRLASERDALFDGSPFRLSRTGVQLTPCDEFCDAGELVIRLEPAASIMTISGEVFAVRRAIRGAGDPSSSTEAHLG